jgi:hypothetical protein
MSVSSIDGSPFRRRDSRCALAQLGHGEVNQGNSRTERVERWTLGVERWALGAGHVAVNTRYLLHITHHA